MGLWMRAAVSVATALVLTGCVAKAAYNVATAPVRVGAKAVDLATTSQSEADRNRGRKMREREERLDKLERKYQQQMARCQNGNRDACDDARVTHAEIGELAPTVPAER